MKPWIKRTILGVVSVVFVILGSLFSFFYFGLSDMCGNEIFIQENSPDGKYKALVFQRDCGATTGFSTQVSVLDANEELENEGGNVFITNNHPNDNRIELHWSNSSSLIIRNTKSTKPLRKEAKIGSVEVRYE